MFLKTNKHIILRTAAVLCLLYTACRDTPAQDKQATTPITTPDSTALAPGYAWPADYKHTLILNTSDYHADEVPGDAARRTWMGLFRNEAGYYLDTTGIKKETVYDPILDEHENGPHTGIHISVPGKDTALLLISGVPGLKAGKVDALAAINTGTYPSFTVQAGDSFKFAYAGAAYTLYARGKKTPVEGQADAYTLSDYRLYLSGIKDGKAVQQLLTAQATFDDAEIGILFCGDLDGDHIPDFIINTSNHYNVYQPTLYLSTAAGKDQWVRMVAKHTSVGC